MKKTTLITVSIVSGVAVTISIIVLIAIYVIPILNIGISQMGNQETFLTDSYSPDGMYKLEAYRTEPGATVDFSIRVYIVKDKQKELIYDAYHEYSAEIVWVNNSLVSINGKILDLSRGEKYDWRKR